MSSHTTTSTTWGSIRVSHTDDGQLVESACKLCGMTTMQAIASDANPFAAAKPDHAKGCRFHPDTKAEPVQRGPRYQHVPRGVRPVVTDDAPLTDWSRREAVIYTLGGAAVGYVAHLVVTWWLH